MSISRQVRPARALDALARLTANWAQEGSAPRSLARYATTPNAFLDACFEWREDDIPTDYQREILDALVTHHRVTVRGPHGLGKTALAAWIILWFAFTREAQQVDWKIITTASSWRQLTHYLWPEVHKWVRRLRWAELGRLPFNSNRELLQITLQMRYGSAFAAACASPDHLEGAHATSLLYLFDEAKSIPDATWDAAEGAFSGAGLGTTSEAFAIAVSTPGEPQGRFYNLHRHAPGFEDWWPRHVTFEEAVAAGRVAADWAEQRAKQWGATSAVYINRVLGEFASSDEDGVIPLAWVELAIERWRDWYDQGLTLTTIDAIGVDVARFGPALTVLAPRTGDVIWPLRRYTSQDTMETTGRVHGLLQAHGGQAIVDVIGVGGGVVDRLRELGASVVAFNAGASSGVRDRSGELGFANQRAAAWWGLRERLDPAFEPTLCLPPEDDLIGDLTAPHWRVSSSGRIIIEDKDAIGHRIGRSTDSGDAVVQACWTPPLVPEVHIY